jgi:uncharacterized protein YdeI (YjbR/CyaY-like superfamily)
MGKRDPRVDAYIAKSPEFAKPILNRIRQEVHAACPDVEEDMKWGSPHFMYKGMMCAMASFKQHAAFGFWKGSLVVGPAATDTNAAGWFGRLTKVSDLPPRKALAAYVRKAMALNDAGIAAPRTQKQPAKPIKVPADLATALRKSKKAKAVFDAFSPSHKREYIEWITEAKSADTRARRLTQAVEWIEAGKSRNWKYERK